MKVLQGTHCTTKVTAVTISLVLLWKAYCSTPVTNSPPGSPETSLLGEIEASLIFPSKMDGTPHCRNFVKKVLKLASK